MNISDLAEKHKRNWNAIWNAEENSNTVRQEIRELFLEKEISLFSSDADFVVFGSIARRECTSKSDVDWTLLVDGPAKPFSYNEISEIIGRELSNAGFPSPGTSEMFGSVSVSNDLVYQIGGMDDTNHNLTKRILLLLESDKISLNPEEDVSGTAYERVVRLVIDQYIENDSSFHAERPSKSNVPRFLLNDIIRFWRTLCVDFANKQIAQKGEKWALRNIKLRTSRKLIYVKGLLMCFSSYKKDDFDTNVIKKNIRQFVNEKPLDFVVRMLLDNKIKEEFILDMLDSYNDFLTILNDENTRKELGKLYMGDAHKNSDFQRANDICHNFQQSLDKIFFAEQTELKDFVLKYVTF